MQRSNGYLLVCMIAAVVTIGGVSPAVSQNLENSQSASRRILHASLYPYIPDASGAYFSIEQTFEALNPEIDLRISLNANYYSEEVNGRGILYEKADVYEVDSVLFADFLRLNKAALLPSGWAEQMGPLVPWAVKIAQTSEDQLYGIPHWLCGNFLWYRAGDTEISKIRNLSDLERSIGRSPRREGSLLIDLKGKSTLGELYLDALMDRYNDGKAALSHVDPEMIDPEALRAIERALLLVGPGMGRDEDYHNRTGFYARQFARGSGRVYVGYSEQLYYALSESMQSCRKDEYCLKHSDLQVAEWPMSDRGSSPIAWVDMLIVDANASSSTRMDAEKFVRFMMEVETYRMLLVPAIGSGDAPRYLLPAREEAYTDPEILEAAPLYTDLRNRIDRATPLTDSNLNRHLRDIGHNIDKLLPVN